MNLHINFQICKLVTTGKEKASIPIDNFQLKKHNFTKCYNYIGFPKIFIPKEKVSKEKTNEVNLQFLKPYKK